MGVGEAPCTPLLSATAARGQAARRAPRQTPGACLLLPPSSAEAGTVTWTQWPCPRQGLRPAAVVPAVSWPSWVCSQLRVQVRMKLRASRLWGALSWPSPVPHS